LKGLGFLFPILSGFIFSLILGKFFIPILIRLKVGQTIRAEGPKSHHTKKGTPTIGGVIFILAIIVAYSLSLLVTDVSPSREGILVLSLSVGYGIVGFMDDYRKVRLGRSLGLRAREKMALLILLAAGFMWFFTNAGSSVIVPFSGARLDLGAFYPLFGIFVIVGTGNAMNLTDGLDGLASGVTIIGLAAYYLVALGYSRVFFVSPAKNSLPSLVLSSIGGILGFLFYNYHPARVFMGDTGSLALGGLLAGLAVATRTELCLPFFAGVPLIEALSVILQVASFQLFGKRIFKMSPLHHHFELSGWQETRVVHFFWALGFLLALFGIFSMAYV